MRLLTFAVFHHGETSTPEMTKHSLGFACRQINGMWRCLFGILTLVSMCLIRCTYLKSQIWGRRQKLVEVSPHGRSLFPTYLCCGAPREFSFILFTSKNTLYFNSLISSLNVFCRSPPIGGERLLPCSRRHQSNKGGPEHEAGNTPSHY